MWLHICSRCFSSFFNVSLTRKQKTINTCLKIAQPQGNFGSFCWIISGSNGWYLRLLNLQARMLPEKNGRSCEKQFLHMLDHMDRKELQVLSRESLNNTYTRCLYLLALWYRLQNSYEVDEMVECINTISAWNLIVNGITISVQTC